MQLVLVFQTSDPYDLDENPLDIIIINIEKTEKETILDKVSELMSKYKEKYRDEWNYQDAVECARKWLHEKGYCNKTDEKEYFDVNMH